MPKYRQREIIVEAEQWYPGSKLPGVRRQPVYNFLGVKVGHADVIDTNNGEVDLQPGDFIVTSGIGRQVYDEATFKQLYVLAGGIDC